MNPFKVQVGNSTPVFDSPFLPRSQRGLYFGLALVLFGASLLSGCTTPNVGNVAQSVKSSTCEQPHTTVEKLSYGIDMLGKAAEKLNYVVQKGDKAIDNVTGLIDDVKNAAREGSINTYNKITDAVEKATDGVKQLKGAVKNGKAAIEGIPDAITQGKETFKAFGDLAAGNGICN